MPSKFKALLAWALCAILLPLPVLAGAAPKLAQITGARLKSSVPSSFYLEGNAIPVELYHAALLQAGQRQFIIALLATSGYSSNIQQKYLGMIIAERGFRLNGARLAVGSYGFGFSKSKKQLRIYNQAGALVRVSKLRYDAKFPHPAPLKVVLGRAASARIYLGRYWVRLRR